MTMSAYDQLDLNKINIKAIEQQIESIETEIGEEKQNEQNLNNQINTQNNAISDLTTKLSKTVFIDNAAIQTEMTNFFAGWVAQMSVLGKSKEEKQEASDTFETTVNTLLISED